VIRSFVRENFITEARLRVFTGSRKVSEIYELNFTVIHHSVRANLVLSTRTREAAEGRDIRRIKKIEIVFEVVGNCEESALRIIIRVQITREAKLLEIVQATDAAGLLFSLRQCRQQHAGEDGSNGDDHQQFNERESSG